MSKYKLSSYDAPGTQHSVYAVIIPTMEYDTSV